MMNGWQGSTKYWPSFLSSPGKSYAIDCTTRFDKKFEVIFFQTSESYRTEKLMDRCNTQKQLDSKNGKVDFQLSFCVNMLNLAVKSYPIYYIVLTHQLNIYHRIFCIIGFLN